MKISLKMWHPKFLRPSTMSRYESRWDQDIFKNHQHHLLKEQSKNKCDSVLSWLAEHKTHVKSSRSLLFLLRTSLMFRLTQKSRQQNNLCLPLQQVFYNHLKRGCAWHEPWSWLYANLGVKTRDPQINDKWSSLEEVISKLCSMSERWNHCSAASTDRGVEKLA
jgi:hypothetical protein